MGRSFLLSGAVVLAGQALLHGQELPAVRRIGEAPWRHAGCSVVAYTPKGNRLITAGGGFRVWDTATGKILHDVASGPILFGPSRVRGVAVVGPNGKQLVTLGHERPPAEFS